LKRSGRGMTHLDLREAAKPNLLEESPKITRREAIKILSALAAIAAVEVAGMPAARAQGEVPSSFKLPERAVKKTGIESMEAIKAICTWCSVGCGIIFYRKGGEIVFATGDPGSPLNKGHLCPKGQASTDLLYSPLRLKYPVIRVGPRPSPEEIIKAKDAKELEALLRKYMPRWRIVDWDTALRYIAEKLRDLLSSSTRRENWGPLHSDGYYYKGNYFPIMILAGAKLLNEEAYIIRKLTMLVGSNNIDHDARKCHSTTVAGLAATFGFGAQTQSFPDNSYVATYLVFGGNPAEAHPVGFSHVMRGKEAGTLTLIVVDPKMGRTAAKADIFAFFRPGSDIAFLYYLLYYAFYERSPPIDQLDTFKGYVRRLNVDMNEINKFKQIVKYFDADRVSNITGIPVDLLRKIAKTFVENSGVTTGFKRFSTIQWAMGLTQHHVGTQFIRLAAIVQLALGNMGYPGGGVNPYRGHSNVQGTTDLCILSHIFPGYVKVPTSTAQIRAYQEWKNQGFPDAFTWVPSKNTCKALGLSCTSCSADGDYCKLKVNSAALLWSWWFMNWRRFELSMGIFVGTDPEDKPWDGKSKVISDLPFGKGYTELTWWMGNLLDRLPGSNEPVIRGMFIFAENPAVSSPNTLIDYAAWGNMDLIVVSDIFFSETAFFADVVLPASSHYEKEGSITNSNRWIMWTERVKEPPGEAKPDLWIYTKLWYYLREVAGIRLPSEVAGKRRERVILYRPDLGMKEPVELYQREIEPFMDYSNPGHRYSDYAEVDPELVYREIDLAVDLYSGMYDWAAMRPLAKRLSAAPRSPSDIDGLWDHITVNGRPYRIWKDWGVTWPKNVRILYNLDGLEKLAGKTANFIVDRGKYALPLDFNNEKGDPVPDGAVLKITGETGEVRDAKQGYWRPAFIPGHNFLLGKFYKRGWAGHWYKVNGKKARLFADLFTGARHASELVRKANVVGKLAVIYEDGKIEVKRADELGFRCPICETFYYDPELVMMGKANFKRPYYKGKVKLADGRTLVYVSTYEWVTGGLHKRFTEELKACYSSTHDLKACIASMMSKYGDWYVVEEGGVLKGINLDYPWHFEPVESPSIELWLEHPPFAWRSPYNRKVLKHYGDEINLTPTEIPLPEGAIPVVVTTNRLTEHWHTGIMTRTLQRLAMLFPEPFVEIPKELADKLGIRDGDIVEVGNRRARIYLRAMVTYRAPVLKIAGKRVYVINIPWSWGFSGLHASTSIANLLTGDYMDTTTTMQESKVFLAYVRKASRDKYVYMKVSEFIKTAKAIDFIPSNS